MYENVSMGFELETQFLCLMFRKNRDLTLPEDGVVRKHVFVQNSVEVYNDKLTRKTGFFKDRIEPFLELPVEPSSVSVPVEKDVAYHLQAPWTFNNQEFVVTFTRKQSIPTEDLVPRILSQFLTALDKVCHVLEQYQVLPIPREDFPYRSVMVPKKTRDPRYGGVAFLVREKPETFSIENLSFFNQCTIGFMLKDSIPIFSILAEKYYEQNKKENEILPLVEQASSLKGGNDRLKGYLFLFLYSAATRNKRKEGAVFVLRHAFQDLRKALTLEEIELLNRWLTSTDNEHKEYFQQLHYEPVPTQQMEKYTRQSLWDVGRIAFRPTEDRVFVEYRGFQTLLTGLVGSGPKSIRRIREALSLSALVTHLEKLHTK